MPCFHPNTIAIYGYGDDGKKKVKFYPGMTYEEYKWYAEHNPNMYYRVPCGQCVGCRMDNARRWTVQNMLESEIQEYSYFVTLTYNDDHVPVKFCLDLGTQNIGYNLVLEPKDLQDWLKRLRIQAFREFGVTNIRFFACGEYGDRTHRPHYHVILYGFKLEDLRPVTSAERNGARVPPDAFTSSFLQETWQNGFITVAELNPERVAYTSRYVLKKQKGKIKEEIIKNAIQNHRCELPDPVTGELLDGVEIRERMLAPQEFIRYSVRDGAIGSGYYKQHADAIKREMAVNIRVKRDLIMRQALPPCIWKQIKEEDLLLYSYQKQKQHEAAVVRADLKLAQSDMTMEQQLAADEAAFVEKLKKYRREI